MIHPESFLPQGEAVAALLCQARADRMTHAILITGESGVGKWTLAWGLAATLLCPQKDASRRPCGDQECRSCVQMENLSHPDLIVIRKGEPLVPSDTKTVIPVSDIEEMIRRIGQQGFEGNRHVVIIRNAEDMQPASQNKLLKTLEEPPEGTFFLLTCPEPDLLLPTIVSRCRPVKLHPWTDQEILRMMREHGIAESARSRVAAEEANGSIGRALRMVSDEAYWEFREQIRKDFLSCSSRSDILDISTRWKDRKEDAEQLFEMLENIFSRMMRISLQRRNGSDSPGEELPARWKQFARAAGPAEYAALFDALSLARKRTIHQGNFQVIVEQLIFSLMEALDR